jgi:hypothetical protein
MSKQKLKQIRHKLKSPHEYYKEVIHYFDNAKELLKGLLLFYPKSHL